MSNDETILGTTKITNRWRISLLKSVREEFEANDDGVEVGDRIVYKIEGDRIVIEPA